jgi:hypothetical protein
LASLRREDEDGVGPQHSLRARDDVLDLRPSGGVIADEPKVIVADGAFSLFFAAFEEDGEDGVGLGSVSLQNGKGFLRKVLGRPEDLNVEGRLDSVEAGHIEELVEKTERTDVGGTGERHSLKASFLYEPGAVGYPK